MFIFLINDYQGGQIKLFTHKAFSFKDKSEQFGSWVATFASHELVLGIWSLMFSRTGFLAAYILFVNVQLWHRPSCAKMRKKKTIFLHVHNLQCICFHSDLINRLVITQMWAFIYIWLLGCAGLLHKKCW